MSCVMTVLGLLTKKFLPQNQHIDTKVTQKTDYKIDNIRETFPNTMYFHK